MFRFINYLFAIGLNACAFDSVKKAYDGPEQPLSELSVLSCSAGTHFVAIDGNKAYTGTGNDCRFAVKPGKRQITMKFFESAQGGRWVYPELHTIEIDAKKATGTASWLISGMVNGLFGFLIRRWTRIKPQPRLKAEN